MSERWTPLQAAMFMNVAGRHNRVCAKIGSVRFPNWPKRQPFSDFDDYLGLEVFWTLDRMLVSTQHSMLFVSGADPEALIGQ